MAAATPVREATTAADATPTLMPERQYLRSIFHPDCDFVDGRIEERNLGEFEHSRVQGTLTRIFEDHERDWGVFSSSECRLQVAPQRYRIPDVMILRRGRKYAHVIRDVPLLCIEVVSPRDAWERIRERLDDYLAMGVEHVWCFEPQAREVQRYTAEGFVKVVDPELTIAGTPVRINVAKVFSAPGQD
jgi:Uma2 family endonuclease